MIPTITVEPSSGVPPDEQIRAQVEVLVRSGHLPAGTSLPTIRQLAHDLGVAPGTVQRAYRELELAGVVESNRRRGTVVLEPYVERTSRVQREQRLESAARELVATARSLGVDLDAVESVLRGQWVVGD
jgi:DNA-binding transcriptional regulator YhcF (GntR family)